MNKTALSSNDEGTNRARGQVGSGARRRSERRRLELAEGLLAEREPLGRRVEALLTSEGRCLDPRRVALRALALAVSPCDGGERRAEPDPALVLGRATLDLVEEQVREELVGTPPEDSPSAGFYLALARLLGLETGAVRSVCARLNALPREERRACADSETRSGTRETRTEKPPKPAPERGSSPTIGRLPTSSGRRVSPGSPHTEISPL